MYSKAVHDSEDLRVEFRAVTDSADEYGNSELIDVQVTSVMILGVKMDFFKLPKKLQENIHYLHKNLEFYEED